MEQLGTAIKYKITRNDIVAVHRVFHANSSSSHPKNIIVKLHSRISRDNILAAFRLAKGITTTQLNISGDPRKVYVNEHLTYPTKSSFGKHDPPPTNVTTVTCGSHTAQYWFVKMILRLLLPFVLLVIYPKFVPNRLDFS